jgi:hypothetical protein
MFACFLLGGMSLALTIGLLDVLVLHADAIQPQASASAGLDLALGLPLLALGALLATGHLHRRRRHSPRPDPKPRKADTWARRVLTEPRFGLAVLIGVVVGTPGASYITALHLIVTGKASTGAQVTAVVVFVIIEFALVIIPFAFLAARPEGTQQAVQRFKDWLTSHARQITAAAALIAGGYMVISGLVRLS